ncbi:MAG: hypothetical protein ACRD9W_17400 [Terriglobia bacterium]
MDQNRWGDRGDGSRHWLSHRATIAWITLSQILGNSNIKIYDGSWTEWGSIVGYPIEK